MLRDRADSEADLRRFIERVINAEIVWALKGNDGFAWCESNDHEGRDVIVFWSDRAYAERARKSEFLEYTPAEINLFDFLFRWLPGMAKDEVLAGANWTGQLIGIESDPNELQDQIINHMPKDMIKHYKEKLKRNTSEEIFLLRIEATPTPENTESDDVGGAYVNAWVDAETLREAEEKAIDRIKEEGWCPVKFEHWELVCKDCYSEESHDKETLPDILYAIEMACEYGVGLIIHTWPIDEAEEE